MIAFGWPRSSYAIVNACLVKLLSGDLNSPNQYAFEEKIHNNRQVAPALFSLNVGHIGAPDLIGSTNIELPA